MSSPRYLLVRFIPDLRRMEPRNVGVILWTSYGVAARFLREKVGRPGEVDGRSVPSWIEYPAVYKQWVMFWRTEIEQDEIYPYTGGAPVSKSDPNFLEVLKTSGSGNFALIDGGILLDPLDEEGLEDAVNYLYENLVASRGEDEPRDTTLNGAVQDLIDRTSLRDNPHFKERYEVSCKVNTKVTTLEFSYAYGNGTPKRLYQRVPLNASQRDAYVHHAAYMFEKVISNKIIEDDEGAALIYLPETHQADKRIKESLAILNDVTRVINLADDQQAFAEFAHLAKIKVHEG